MATMARATYSGAAQTLAAGGTVAYSSTTETCGASCDGQVVTLSKAGTYLVTATATIEATAAGAVGVALYRGGSAVAGASATDTAAAAGDYASQCVETLVTVPNCGAVALSLRAAYAESVTAACILAVRV